MNQRYPAGGSRLLFPLARPCIPDARCPRPAFSRRLRQAAGLWGALLACCLFVHPAAGQNQSWDQSSFTISQNAAQGTYEIHFLVFNPLAPSVLGPLPGILVRLELFYSTDEGDHYTQIFQYRHTPALYSPRNGAFFDPPWTYSEGFTTWIGLRLHVQGEQQHITHFKVRAHWRISTVFAEDADFTREARFLSLPPVKAAVSYRADGRAALVWNTTDADNLSARISRTVVLQNGQSLDSTTQQSGTFYVPQAPEARTYTLRQWAYNGLIWTDTVVTVPAFAHPTGLTATYNDETDKVDLRWTIPPATGAYVKAPFKLQRATKADFSDAVNISLSAYQSTKYNPDSVAYMYSEPPHANVYYRVARDSADWGWDLAQSVYFNVPHATIDDQSQLTLQLNADKNRTILHWTPSGLWTPGATFTINRINNTNNSSTAISLSKEDYYAGVFVDSQVTACNEYAYSLQVTPAPDLGFASPKPFVTAQPVLPVTLGKIEGLQGSKGYFPDRTELRWQSHGSFDNFLIKRKVYGEPGDFLQIATVPGSSVGEYQTDDSKGTPGVYYEYLVVGAVGCNNTTIYSEDTLYTVGFRGPTGNIYGRVTYANGQAVQNATVRLENRDAPMGQSMKFDGSPKSYLRLDSLVTPLADSAFTIEAWIRPDDAAPKSQVIFARDGQYRLGFDAAGQLYFDHQGKQVAGLYRNPNGSYVHVAAVQSADSLFLYLNDSLLASAAAKAPAPGTPSDVVFIGRFSDGGSYRGYIDEMRLWNVALPGASIARDYTRALAGNEPGLVAYWRFDETIVDQFYDLSHQGDTYHRNDGHMDPSAVSRSSVVPTFDQLSFKAYTDSTGNYMIAGVPYTGSNGTTYTIVPLFGTHQFDPVAVNRLLSASSPAFTVDFTDNSAFDVSGYVYYRDGTVPVPGVQFKIDGVYAQQSNGDLIETDPNGRFTISVPVGTHEVKAVKNNHVFVGGGRIMDGSGHDLNYQGPVSERVLRDSTTVRLIGRVGGGAVQDAYPLGHSLSVNNLGREMSISLKLFSGDKYEVHSGTPDTTVTVYHLLPSDQTDSAKIHRTRVVYRQNEIVIYPDSLTGEFAADIIPEKFNVQKVEVTGWGNLLTTQDALDLTDKFFTQTSVHAYEDSAETAPGEWAYHSYSDTVFYNESYKKIARVTPTLAITQLDGGGQPLPYFGDPSFETHDLAGQSETIPVVDTTKSGLAKYLFGHPVFRQKGLYSFRVKAYEEYPFYESVKGDGTPVIAQENGKDRISRVPTEDGLVSFYNNLREGAVQADTLGLDAQGERVYSFTVGDPDIAAMGIKDLSADVQFGSATHVSWSWESQPKLQAFVVGGKMSGTDFVTAGPDELLMVLRDPPGSRSYSFAEQGSTVSHTSTYSGSVDQVGDLSLVTKLGVELVTFVGLGGGVINSAVTTTGLGFGVHHEEHYIHEDTKTSTTTLTTNFQTSDDPGYVGADGDLFVGYSTNITYGQSNNITIIARDELKATDTKIYEAGPASPYLLVARSGINIGQSFGTLFAYPQKHIEQVLIPNLITIRNTILLPETTSPGNAQAAADNTHTAVYVSKLPADDPNFGKSNNDAAAFGDAAKTSPFNNGPSYTIYFPTGSVYRTDTIMTINQYVANWKKRMSENEMMKLAAQPMQNYSFHSGSPVTYSETRTLTQTRNESFNFILSGSVFNSTDVDILGNGFEFSFNEAIGTAQGGSVEDEQESSSTLGFTLSSDGEDEYLSVDVDKAQDGGMTFRTKGGVTGCPYEPATTTKYYLPGTVLDQPTERIEVPNLAVDAPVVNGVPATRNASYQLYLRNESEAKLPASFVLTYADIDSVKGATLAVDGSPIGGQGREITVPYGETVTKVLTLTRGPQAMDYNNIPVILRSSCQSDIADTVLLSAHFVPSCSDIHLALPAAQWILNSESEVNASQQHILPVRIDKFDVNNSLFDHIELQVKPSSASGWSTVMKFYADSAHYKAAQGERAVITNPEAIVYNLVMDDGAFSDQPYDIQAVAVCALGPGSFVMTPSNMVSGLKDTYTPRLFGTPQPANGVLGVEDDIRLNFNEPIAAGLLTQNAFQVTGIRNGTEGDHSVSVRLDGQTGFLATEFDKNLTGKDLTVELWVLADGLSAGTVFSHGQPGNALEIAFTAQGRLAVTVGSKTVESDKPVSYQDGNWAHVALVYHTQTGTVSAYYNYVEMIHDVNVGPYTGTGHFEFGRSIAEAGNYFAGRMHGVRVWTQALSAVRLQTGSLTRLSGAESGLLAYYPMTEGKGSVAYDKAHGANAVLQGSWSTPPGRSVALEGNGYLKLNTASVPLTADMDYTMGLWFKGRPGQQDATLAANGLGDGSDPGGSENLFFLGFEHGVLTYRNNGFSLQADGQYLDGQWHHVAVAVNRNAGVVQLYVDGVLNNFADARSLGGLAAAYIYLGARAYFTPTDGVNPTIDDYFQGQVDEFRLWNTYLNQTLIQEKNNVRLAGDELGLLAYYPFEHYHEVQNNQELEFTYADLTLHSDGQPAAPPALAVQAQPSEDMAPVKDRGPVDNLRFDFVVNNDALIINLLEEPHDIDKTIVTFRVKDVRDVHGNKMHSPVTWTAYIDRNQLKWSEDELQFTKDLHAPLSFDADIENHGGSVEHFSLDQLPAWLTASPASGTVDPQGRQTIHFTVNSGLNAGSVDEVVYLRNDNGETEGLQVNVRVRAPEPAWTVNPADHKYAMTIYGKIRIDGVFSADAEDKLAAFSGGRCVGVTTNTYNAGNDIWYAFLTVYGDSATAGPLEFRLWDASTGKTYQGLPSTAVSFANNAIAGTPREPVIIDGREMQFQDIPLVKGWNWISFNLGSPALSDVNAALANGSWHSGDIVKNELLGFDQYSSIGSWVGYLPGLNNSALFMLQTSEAQTLSTSGSPLDLKANPITILGGRWNYIGYLPQVNLPLAEALAGYEASENDVIKSQTGFAMYDPDLGWVGNLSYLEPGKGYMLLRTAAGNTTLVYPETRGSLDIHRQASGDPLHANGEPLPGLYRFAENMTLIAVTDSGAGVKPGDRLMAYVGGELRGQAVAATDPVTGQAAFFLNVSGDQALPLTFALQRGGELLPSSTVLTYRSNTMAGDLGHPLVVSFRRETGPGTGALRLFPNPFADRVYLRLQLPAIPATHRVQLSVYDLRGALLLQRAPEQAGAGEYQTAWDGRDARGAELPNGVYIIRLTVDGEARSVKVMKFR